MSLQVWLPLNGDLKNLGVSNITVTNDGATIDNNGKIGKCYSFNGTNNKIIIDNFSVDNEWSYGCWLYSATSTRGWEGVIILNTNGGDSDMQLGLYTYPTGNRIQNTANGQYNSGISFTYGQWNHFLGTFDGSSLRTYINGVLVNTKAITNGILSRSKLTIGARCRGSSYDAFFQGKINDIRIYDHCLSAAEVKEISQGLVLHYPLNRQSLKPIGTNLVTGVTKGGQTTLLTDGRVGVVTSGTSADTYFTVNLSESITNGTTYYLSCDVSGVSEGQYWGFPLGAQNNTSMPSKFYNGHNEYIFTANDINWGANRLFLDDNYRNDYAHPASFYNFVLIKNPTFEEVDGSGFGHNSTSNAPIITSEDTGRYEEASYFGAYNTPVLTADNFSVLAPALTSCTITWWGKYDTTTTLLLTGQSTSFYVAASANNNYYHANIGSPTMYKDGIAGTYKCAADGWHHFALTGVNFSTWTALKLNGYGSGWPLKGYISDLRIYNTVLSAADILQLYHTSAKVDNQQNFHTFELEEAGGPELLAVPLTTSYGNRTNIYTAYNDDGEITLTGGSSIGSDYIPISPTGKVYYFDIDVSIDAGNQFYIGFERFDVDKAATSNSSCDYVVAVKPSSALIHQHYFGTRTWTANLSTGKPPAYIALRILNDWSGANGRKATIHSISLREISVLTNEQILKAGITKADEFIEGEKTAIQQNKIIRSKNFIEL